MSKYGLSLPTLTQIQSGLGSLDDSVEPSSLSSQGSSATKPGCMRKRRRRPGEAGDGAEASGACRAVGGSSGAREKSGIWASAGPFARKRSQAIREEGFMARVLASSRGRLAPLISAIGPTNKSETRIRDV